MLVTKFGIGKAMICDWKANVKIEQYANKAINS